LPLALFGIAIAGALLPPLSRSVQSGNKQEYAHFMEFALRRVSAFLIPCMVLLSISGTHVINLLFGYGDFQAHSILTTTGCLHGYILGLLPMGLIIILAPACYAHKNFKAPMWGAILSMSINIILDALLVFCFGMKAISVALATSIASWVNVFYLYKRLEQHAGKIITEEGASEGMKALFVAIAAALCTWLIQQYFFYPASFFHYNFDHLSRALCQTMGDKIAALLLPSITYVGLSYCFARAIQARDTLLLFGLKK
jgi:putative peptidoglycan lipid II flippase